MSIFNKSPTSLIILIFKFVPGSYIIYFITTSTFELTYSEVLDRHSESTSDSMSATRSSVIPLSIEIGARNHCPWRTVEAPT